MGLPLGYLGATRHPFPCLVFVVPLLVAYEAGVLALGGPNPETIRNGADHWMRCAFTGVGLQVPWLPPVLLAGGLVAWAILRREDRPGDLGGVLCGMVLESVAFALGLWGISRILAPLLVQAGFELSVASGSEPALRQVVTYLGAGIYEEALFRLVLFSALVGLLRWLDLPTVFAVLAAALGSAILFSTAHHVGPYGQAYSNYLFLFRLAAGLYFAFLFQLRGFGIVVGAHACYNVMVTIS
ncbi:MAG: CPBP family intramembrane metalloprotease [Gemmataceae bacterium]|nr:CPBP family intramembrane metalloprotease [Gemmataceae bacterium]